MAERASVKRPPGPDVPAACRSLSAMCSTWCGLEPTASAPNSSTATFSAPVIAAPKKATPTPSMPSVVRILATTMSRVAPGTVLPSARGSSAGKRTMWHATRSVFRATLHGPAPKRGATIAKFPAPRQPGRPNPATLRPRSLDPNLRPESLTKISWPKPLTKTPGQNPRPKPPGQNPRAKTFGQNLWIANRSALQAQWRTASVALSSGGGEGTPVQWRRIGHSLAEVTGPSLGGSMTTLQVSAQKQLRQFVEQIERLEEEKKALTGDIRDKYLEAKATGFDVKALRKIV